MEAHHKKQPSVINASNEQQQQKSVRFGFVSFLFTDKNIKVHNSTSTATTQDTQALSQKTQTKRRTDCYGQPFLELKQYNYLAKKTRPTYVQGNLDVM